MSCSSSPSSARTACTSSARGSSASSFSRDDGSGSCRRGELRALFGVQADGERHLAEPQRHRPQLFRPQPSCQPAGQHAVPQVALVGRQVEAAQLRPQPGDGAAEVVGVDAQVIDQAAGVAARQLVLQRRPVAPVFAQQRLFLLLRPAVELIRGGQGQAQGVLETAAHQQTGDELLPSPATEPKRWSSK